jgi:metal-responsive CopG/Arc/MetJ family transcriptional regulator
MLYYGMKTAISLPDALFASGDKLARRLGVSRSELYARALAEFVAKHKGSDVTRRLDAVYAREEGRLDPAAMAAQVRTLPRESW